MSRRSAAFKRRLVGPASWILRNLVRVLGRTYRFREIHGGRLDRLFEDGRPVIISFWHDQSFVATWFMIKNLHLKGFRLVLLASPSRDGELVVRAVAPWKLQVVRGSASRGGQGAIMSMRRALLKNEGSPVVTPDGPRGPRCVCKPGTVLLARFSGAPVVPFGFAAARRRQLHSWDRLFIPLLLSRVTVSVGEPLEVPRDMGDEELEGYRVELERRLDECRDEALVAVGRSPDDDRIR